MTKKVATKVEYLDRTIQWSRVQYALCLTEQQFYGELKSLGITERPQFTLSGATTHHFNSTESGEAISLVCIAKWNDKDPIQIAALLMHEAVHIWQRHCELIGEETPGRENEAYAIQGLAQELMFSFRKQVYGT